ncbi:hypothetical protein T458_23635 [Brevibacillus panacihumi W25]|uniref:BclA C-terminal domain-containing protein n=1 Tax=Brevibacillus panacihumi W25 TaxID=1408254 RepID=V6MEE7_9BACL|nr:hypothetical protein [Brevibacillus panacihumi]EST53758.1 hypothetical protein T458_23635 [Brevibacillus panacihumi W25]
MSIPGIPNIDPKITITRDDAVNLLLSAMAMEQLSLTQILAVEGDKIKYALGTLPGAGYESDVTMDELMTIDTSVKETLDTAIRLEMLLQSRLETLLQLPGRSEERGPVPSYPELVVSRPCEEDEVEEMETANTDFGASERGSTSMVINGFGANTRGAILRVVKEGIPIPLSDNQVLQGIFTDEEQTAFTVPDDGNYLITYVIQFTEALPIHARITINEEPYLPTVIASNGEQTSFTNTVLAPLAAGDAIALQLYGFDGEAVLQTGAGATLTIVKL